MNRWLSWSLERSCTWSQTEGCTCISTFEPTLSFDLSSPQLADERLWAERLHACVEPLPLGGAALGLCLDLVVHLLGSGLWLLLGPPFCSRYQSYTHPQLKGIYCADFNLQKKMFCVTSYVNSCCFLRVFWKHNCSFTWRVQLKSSESRPKKTNDIPDFKFACSPSVVFTIVSQSIQTIAQEESLLLHACLFFCFNYKFIVIISLAEKFECRHIVTY